MRLRALGCSDAITRLTGIYLAFGLVMLVESRITGNESWMEGFFQSQGPLLALWLALVACTFSYRARALFTPNEPMRTAWTLLCLSAACEIAGVVVTQILAAPSVLNPLFHIAFWSPGLSDQIRHVGLLLGGVCRYWLVAWGLWYAAGAYRKLGFLAGFRWMDHVLLGIMAVYVMYEIMAAMIAISVGRPPTMMEIAGWPVVPLLAFLLAQVLLLRRSAKEMGGGCVGRCWEIMSLGVMLVAAGAVLFLAARLGYLPWSFRALQWYIWLPAGAAFALAPVYQVEAVSRASSALALTSE